MKVIFFDIDGTLMLTGGAGYHALKIAMREVFAIDEPAEVTVHGQTDRGIAGELFRCHDIDNSHENFTTFIDTYLRHLEDQLPQRQGSLLPGVEYLLPALAERDDVELGVLTGNVSVGAQLKLSHFGIDHYFGFGGFGDEHPNRNDVANAARDHAESTLGRKLAPDSMWVVGDTANDVRCARAIGANALAVSTGGSDMDELRRSEPDELFVDLSAVEEVISVLTDSRTSLR